MAYKVGVRMKLWLLDRHFYMHFRERDVFFIIGISLKFVPRGPIDNNPALFQVMAWRRIGDKPLS